MEDNYNDRRPSGPPAIHTEKIEVGSKIFFLDLKENARGRFVKITEDVKGHRDTIMVPAEILDEFADAIDRIADADEEKS